MVAARCIGPYPDKTATSAFGTVPRCPIQTQTGAADEFFNTRKIGTVFIPYAEDQLMTVTKLRRAAEDARFQLFEPVALHADIGSEGYDDRDADHAEAKWYC